MLVAPNVSEQMGGEAIKALQIFSEFAKINPNTVQITHERCRAELSVRLGMSNVEYVRDTLFAKFLWRSIIFRQFLDTWFSIKAISLADRIALSKGWANRTTVIHQTEPNSPVTIRKFSSKCLNAIGPVNGNIYFPEIFRNRESFRTRLRRMLHFPIQRMNSVLFARFKRADLVLAAGGARTIDSLLAAGYSRSVIKSTLDCGTRDDLLDSPRIQHHEQNFKFVHFGRLVYHKGTFLAIEGLRYADSRVTLDIIGSGPELVTCRRLVQELGLSDRVRFIGWFKSHDELIRSLREYRGMVLPSLEDANGVVVQEALALGLPPICLDWGGPQLLVENGVSGFLISPKSKQEIARGIGLAFDRLSQEPELAERISAAGRAKAETWRWSRLAREWMAYYPL